MGHAMAMLWLRFNGVTGCVSMLCVCVVVLQRVCVVRGCGFVSVFCGLCLCLNVRESGSEAVLFV